MGACHGLICLVTKEGYLLSDRARQRILLDMRVQLAHASESGGYSRRAESG